MLKVIKRIYPCTFYGSNRHYVEECWKQKVYSEKVHATRSNVQKDDATLQVKKILGNTLIQSGKISASSKELGKIQQKDDQYKLKRKSFSTMQVERKFKEHMSNVAT